MRDNKRRWYEIDSLNLITNPAPSIFRGSSAYQKSAVFAVFHVLKSRHVQFVCFLPRSKMDFDLDSLDSSCVGKCGTKLNTVRA